MMEIAMLLFLLLGIAEGQRLMPAGSLTGQNNPSWGVVDPLQIQPIEGQGATTTCSCEIKVDRQVLYQYAQYTIATSRCHTIQVRCREQCRRTFKESFLYKDLRDTDLESSKTIGYNFCSRYGQVTPRGGVTVSAFAKVESCRHEKKVGKLSTKLCCGHTAVTLEQRTLLAFGWDVNCDATAFHLQ
ncbi:unnamed protein product [Owenia fusiformis]|uniref:Uncharacterized protein n=1 Tax=Owenia fusiformis TaxID=6347 RepID=A0A8J1XK92_OWEFU|nr:unnamed protein product [Owenia fusiformis]